MSHLSSWAFCGGQLNGRYLYVHSAPIRILPAWICTAPKKSCGTGKQLATHLHPQQPKAQRADMDLMPRRRLSSTFQCDTSVNTGQFWDVHLMGSETKDTASRRGICESGEGQGQKDREMLECFMIRSKRGLFLFLKKSKHVHLSKKVKEQEGEWKFVVLRFN